MTLPPRQPAHPPPYDGERADWAVHASDALAWVGVLVIGVLLLLLRGLGPVSTAPMLGQAAIVLPGLAAVGITGDSVRRAWVCAWARRRLASGGSALARVVYIPSFPGEQPMSRVVLRLAGSDEEVELTFMETGPLMVEGTEGRCTGGAGLPRSSLTPARAGLFESFQALGHSRCRAWSLLRKFPSRPRV